MIHKISWFTKKKERRPIIRIRNKRGTTQCADITEVKKIIKMYYEQ